MIVDFHKAAKYGDPLTKKQDRILELLSSGYNGNQIAAQRGMSESCVSRQLNRAKLKLGAQTLSQAAVKYDRMKWGSKG